MAETWPASLPQCFILPYNEGMADGLIETQPDTGPPITRRRSSAATRGLSGQMRMTLAQLEDLETFVNTTIGGGALPFTFKNPRDPAGDPLLVKFGKGSLPTWQPRGPGKFLVNVSLTVLP